MENYKGKKGRMASNIPAESLYMGEAVVVLDQRIEGKPPLAKTCLSVQSLERRGEAKWVNKSDVLVDE